VAKARERCIRTGVALSYVAAYGCTGFAVGVAISREPALQNSACLGVGLTLLMCGVAIGYLVGRMRDCADASGSAET